MATTTKKAREKFLETTRKFVNWQEVADQTSEAEADAFAVITGAFVKGKLFQSENDIEKYQSVIKNIVFALNEFNLLKKGE